MAPESPRPDAPLESALRRLSRPEHPPHEVEDRIVSLLASRGWIRGAGNRRRSFRALLAAAAAVALFAAGMFAGSRHDAVAEGPRYALLLLGGPGYAAPSAGEEQAIVERYRAWAEGLRAQGALVLAERLGDTVAVVQASGVAVPDQSDVLGIFIVVAQSNAEAEAIAAASPHAARGGRIAVVRNDPT